MSSNDIKILKIMPIKQSDSNDNLIVTAALGLNKNNIFNKDQKIYNNDNFHFFNYTNGAVVEQNEQQDSNSLNNFYSSRAMNINLDAPEALNLLQEYTKTLEKEKTDFQYRLNKNKTSHHETSYFQHYEDSKELLLSKNISQNQNMENLSTKEIIKKKVGAIDLIALNMQARGIAKKIIHNEQKNSDEHKTKTLNFPTINSEILPEIKIPEVIVKETKKILDLESFNQQLMTPYEKYNNTNLGIEIPSTTYNQIKPITNLKVTNLSSKINPSSVVQNNIGTNLQINHGPEIELTLNSFSLKDKRPISYSEQQNVLQDLVGNVDVQNNFKNQINDINFNNKTVEEIKEINLASNFAKINEQTIAVQSEKYLYEEKGQADDLVRSIPKRWKNWKNKKSIEMAKINEKTLIDNKTNFYTKIFESNQLHEAMLDEQKMESAKKKKLKNAISIIPSNNQEEKYKIKKLKNGRQRIKKISEWQIISWESTYSLAARIISLVAVGLLLSMLLIFNSWINNETIDFYRFISNKFIKLEFIGTVGTYFNPSRIFAVFFWLGYLLFLMIPFCLIKKANLYLYYIIPLNMIILIVTFLIVSYSISNNQIVSFDTIFQFIVLSFLLVGNIIMFSGILYHKFH